MNSRTDSNPFSLLNSENKNWGFVSLAEYDLVFHYDSDDVTTKRSSELEDSFFTRRLSAPFLSSKHSINGSPRSRGSIASPRPGRTRSQLQTQHTVQFQPQPGRKHTQSPTLLTKPDHCETCHAEIIERPEQTAAINLAGRRKMKNQAQYSRRQLSTGPVGGPHLSTLERPIKRSDKKTKEDIHHFSKDFDSICRRSSLKASFNPSKGNIDDLASPRVQLGSHKSSPCPSKLLPRKEDTCPFSKDFNSINQDSLKDSFNPSKGNIGDIHSPHIQLRSHNSSPSLFKLTHKKEDIYPLSKDFNSIRRDSLRASFAASKGNMHSPRNSSPSPYLSEPISKEMAKLPVPVSFSTSNISMPKGLSRGRSKFFHKIELGRLRSFREDSLVRISSNGKFFLESIPETPGSSTHRKEAGLFKISSPHSLQSRQSPSVLESIPEERAV